MRIVFISATRKIRPAPRLTQFGEMDVRAIRILVNFFSWEFTPPRHIVDATEGSC